MWRLSFSSQRNVGQFPRQNRNLNIVKMILLLFARVWKPFGKRLTTMQLDSTFHRIGLLREWRILSLVAAHAFQLLKCQPNGFVHVRILARLIQLIFVFNGHGAEWLHFMQTALR